MHLDTCGSSSPLCRDQWPGKEAFAHRGPPVKRTLSGESTAAMRIYQRMQARVFHSAVILLYLRKSALATTLLLWTKHSYIKAYASNYSDSPYRGIGRKISVGSGVDTSQLLQRLLNVTFSRRCFSAGAKGRRVGRCSRGRAYMIYKAKALCLPLTMQRREALQTTHAFYKEVLAV